MSQRDARVVHADDVVPTLHGAGDEYRILATGEHTAGDYFVMEAVVPPGGGPPAHIQTREEEAFYVLDGEVAFYPGGKRVVAKKGTYLNIPRGLVHHFRNESEETAHMLIFFAPAGVEEMMEKMAADPENYVRIGKDYGVDFEVDD